MDFQKAFDSVDREALWNILRMYGIPDKIIHLIENIHKDSECTVLGDAEPTALFKVKTGARQRCILSPILFCLAVDYVMKSHIAISSGIAWTGNNTRLGDLDFADDICLLNSSQLEMQEKTKVLSQQAAKIGIQINKKKTETMRNFDVKTPIKLEEDELNEVNKFTYLGSIVTTNGNCLPDIKNRISKAAGAMNKLHNFWKDRNIGLKTKLQIYKSNVTSVLLYGSDNWTMNKGSERKLASFHLSCLRRLLNMRWYDYISNDEVMKRANTESIATIIKRRRWKYLGHALRMDQKRIPKQAWELTPPGSRRRSRPRNTLKRTIRDDMRSGNIIDVRLSEKAQDRQGWRALLSALCT